MKVNLTTSSIDVNVLTSSINVNLLTVDTVDGHPSQQEQYVFFISHLRIKAALLCMHDMLITQYKKL